MSAVVAAPDVGSADSGWQRTATMLRAQGASSDAILLGAVILWALSYPMTKFAVGQFEPIALACIRFVAASSVLLVILWLRERDLAIRGEDLPRLVVAGFLGVTLTQATWVYAFLFTSASNISLLGATTPIVTAALGTAVGLERSGRRHWAAAGLGFGGVVLIMLGGPGGPSAESGLPGDVLALVSTVAAAASTLVIVPLLTRYSVARVVTYELLIGALMLVPIALPAMLAQDTSRITVEGWASLAYLVLATGVVTNLLYATAIRRVGASRSAVYRYLQAFLGVVFAVILLGEHVGVVQLVGGAIVVWSVLLSRSSNRSCETGAARTSQAR